MRRSILLLTCITLVSINVVTANCQHSQETSPHLSGAEKRSSLPLKKALFGHWVTVDGGTHYFFNEGYFLSVYGGKAQTIKITILEVNEESRTLRLKINDHHFENCTFSSDRMEVSELAELIGFKDGKPFKIISDTPMMWKYVDGSLKPTADLIKSTFTGEPMLEMQSLPDAPKFIRGDKKTKIYYWEGCPDYDKVPLERRDYFRTRKEAQREGYRAAKNC